MSEDFFRFPHTPHLAWLGEGRPRDDKVLTPEQVAALLADAVVVEEKLDGANLGLSVSPQGGLRAQNRGQYLVEPFTGQFSRLGPWLAQHRQALLDHLTPGLILFGEWCAARHSLAYSGLPDWFLVFDVYDREAAQFWDTARRDELTKTLGLVCVPTLHRGKVTQASLRALLETRQSRYRSGPPEGIVIKREGEGWTLSRAKLVRAEFVQTIGAHWRNRSIKWNRVARSRE
ncbi:MAG: RNA ligase family protein [Aquimonas sp.]|nr:RNA ligase family protein [Aquimonas sp.]